MEKNGKMKKKLKKMKNWKNEEKMKNEKKKEREFGFGEEGSNPSELVTSLFGRPPPPLLGRVNITLCF